MANAAFHIGLALHAAKDADQWRDETPFDLVHHDFYRAAREGPDARIMWPRALGGSGVAKPARDWVEAVLPLAQSGLESAEVESEMASSLLDVIAGRAENGQTGAVWQREALARAESKGNREEAIGQMFRGYLERSRTGEPVHLWRPLA